jgi:hypothetical protein
MHCSARTRQREQYGGEQWSDAALMAPPLRAMRAMPPHQLPTREVSDSIPYSASFVYSSCRSISANHVARKAVGLSQRCAQNSPVYDNLMQPIQVNVLTFRVAGYFARGST